MTYAWDFGDGTWGTGVGVTHTYAGTGTQPLTARLTVTDPQGATGTSALTVVPGNRVPRSRRPRHRPPSATSWGSGAGSPRRRSTRAARCP